VKEMKNIPEIADIAKNLFEDHYIQQVLISTIDGSPIFGEKRDDIGLGDELFVIPAAISSALSISNGFMESTLEDKVKEYVVFQEDSIILASREGNTVLILTISLPKTSFEPRPPIDDWIKRSREAVAKVDAIVKTLDIEDSLIEKDSAQLAAVSSALSLPTRILGKPCQSVAVTGKNNIMLLYALDADRILMVSLAPKHSVEHYLTQISQIVAH
jgi:predicted regulator of Ras-like GTPase activity (Roadblock/LC7/MglB family)